MFAYRRVCFIHICGFPKIGVFFPKWMVKIMENPVKMDDLGGKPTILETPISGQFICDRKHERFSQMVVKSKGNGTPAISGKSRLVKYYSLARHMPYDMFFCEGCEASFFVC